MRKKILFILFSTIAAVSLRADLHLPAIFSDHMVLQREQGNRIWGWDAPNTKITLSFSGTNYTSTTDTEGKWTITLNASPANAHGQSIAIQGTTSREIKDVLIGEVWICSGQSNMEWFLSKVRDGDLAILAAANPQIRLIHVTKVGTQELQDDFKGRWDLCTPETVANFSAIGYHFGSNLQAVLDVPIGLIDNAWGGSAAEAWVRRETLANHPTLARMLPYTEKREAYFATPESKIDYAEKIEQWEEAVALAKSENQKVPRKPQSPENWLGGNKRVGNIFAGVLHPTIGYGIRGVIWYQGEANATRAANYRELFPLLIQHWREEWNQGDFPFYWVQLADFKQEKQEPGESDWAELREAQTLTQNLPETGQAVIVDLGDAENIHPRRKQEVAARLTRLALAKTYGYEIPYRSPEYSSLEIEDDVATVHIECYGSSLVIFDSKEAKGFAICGKDRVWHWAEAKIVGGDQIQVTSEQVNDPVAVRYAWADNPVCNVISKDDLPLTPFRTDDFPMTTEPKSE